MIEISEGQARRYCELLGVDPDERVTDPQNRTMAYVTCPRWMAAIPEMLRTLAVLEAIREPEAP